MGFVAVCRAVYDYAPQSNGELELKEGDLLYIVEKSSDDDWWKAKKKAVDEDEDEPEGLVPNNYVEDAAPTHKAKALYDYARQTEEEVSFSEDGLLEVYDNSDPDWTLVCVDGEYGFAPANYIELTGAATKAQPTSTPRSPVAAVPRAPEPEQQRTPPASPARAPQSPLENLAQVMGGRIPSQASRQVASPPLPPRQQTPEASDEEEPPRLPQRPPSSVVSPIVPAPPQITYDDDPRAGDPRGVLPSPPDVRIPSRSYSDDAPMRSPGGFHLYNVNEMVSAMGKRKKMPVTLGINIATGTIMFSPEKSRDGPSQEWTADKLEHYSIEGKHVFLELNRPSKSLDLHAGAKDTAQEIVAGLGEIAGAHRAEGLKEVIDVAMSGGRRKGVVLYDFMAQGDDEVTVAEGDEVVILDDTKSEEWWNVRRLKNGNEGVVPSSYIEITGTMAVEPSSRSGVNAGKSTVEQNRLEEERMAKEAARANKARRDAEEARQSRELPLPERDSSLGSANDKRSKRDKRSSKSDNKSRSKPDTSKVRTWTDHSGSFKVDAQFLGVADGKIHLHKVNGIKIAVPVTKMSQNDLDYVEKVTNEPIDDHIPVADLIKMKRKSQSVEASRSGASIEPSRPEQPRQSDYDWFDFFLTAGVNPHQCERYAQAMIRDSMDETVLPDIKIETLRTLGLKEGDALKVMKYLDQRFGRNRGGEGGIFAGEGGALKNNTSRQRPDAQRAVSDVVDANALSGATKSPTESTATPLATAPKPEANGFDDDAWTVKKPAAAPRPQPSVIAPPATKPVSQNMQDLSLLDEPLKPSPAAPPRPASQPQVSEPAPPAPQQTQPTGANPTFFNQVNQLQSQPAQLAPPRQRPHAPQNAFTDAPHLAPPPRPTSAPQTAHNQYSLQPLQAQMTGLPSNAHPAPPGQSLDEITAQRMQQLAALRAQPTGFPQYGMQNGMQMQPTGFGLQQPYLNGNVAGSPFADSRAMQTQTPAFNQFGQPQIQLPQATGVNAFLPPALAPQRTGFVQSPPPANNFGYQQGLQPQQTGYQPQLQPQLQPQPTGFPQSQALQPQPTGFGMNGFNNQSIPPVPPMPTSTTPAPLVPQRTAAPDIKFGMSKAKIVPQPTGRRANLASATPDNPFGF